MDHADWLAQVDEEVLEPDLEICDPHHHLWDSFAGKSAPRCGLQTKQGQRKEKSVRLGPMASVRQPSVGCAVAATEFLNGCTKSIFA